MDNFTPASFAPDMLNYSGQTPFRFWCQKVLPLVFDDSLSYYELLNKMVIYLNNVIGDMSAVETNVTNLDAAFEALEGWANTYIGDLYIAVTALDQYVRHYFDNLDVQAEIDSKLDEMASDGTLAEIFSNSVLGFVSPEMYGAIGDGVANDWEAWQRAVDSGFTVIAQSKKYKLSNAIVVSHDITIDCNNAEFELELTPITDPVNPRWNENRIFICAGEIDSTGFTNADYTANNPNYVISDTDNANYTGMALVQGENVIAYHTNGLPTGIVTTFVNGKMTEDYPFDITNITIYKITPITVEIKRLGNIKFDTANSQAVGTRIEYGINCTVDGLNGTTDSAYSVVTLSYCLNCRVTNSVYSSTFDTLDNVYIFLPACSAHTTFSNCKLYNKKWHCISTSTPGAGDTHCAMNYKTVVDNCVLHTSSTSAHVGAYLDHGNSRDTEIRNSTVSGFSVQAGAKINNVTEFFSSVALSLV